MQLRQLHSCDLKAAACDLLSRGTVIIPSGPARGCALTELTIVIAQETPLMIHT